MFTKDNKSYTGDVVNIAQGVGYLFYIIVLTASRSVVVLKCVPLVLY